MWKRRQRGRAARLPARRFPNVEVAGKTGTAEFWRNGVKDNHTWFMCFAPYQKPKYHGRRVHPGREGRGGHGRADCRAHFGGNSSPWTTGNLPVPRSSRSAPAKGSFAFINNVDFTQPHRRRARAPPVRTPTIRNGKLAMPATVAENNDEAPPPDSDEHESRRRPQFRTQQWTTTAPSDRRAQACATSPAAVRQLFPSGDDERGGQRHSSAAKIGCGNFSGTTMPVKMATTTDEVKSQRHFFRKQQKATAADNGQSIPTRHRMLPAPNRKPCAQATKSSLGNFSPTSSFANACCPPSSAAAHANPGPCGELASRTEDSVRALWRWIAISERDGNPRCAAAFVTSCRADRLGCRAHPLSSFLWIATASSLTARFQSTLRVLTTLRLCVESQPVTLRLPPPFLPCELCGLCARLLQPLPALPLTLHPFLPCHSPPF